jgi:molybdenum cofactor cytidylyltransferase
MVSAIILSAGASGRMGSPKALLKIGKKTFLQHIIEILTNQSIKQIHVVLGADADEIKPSIAGLSVNVIVNYQWQNGQLSSLIAGLDAIHETQATGVLVWPVDHPIVSGIVINEMINAFENHPDTIIIPKYDERRGHPVIFPQSIFNDLRSAPLNEGARSVVRGNEDMVYEVDTGEEGILINIDTPEYYEKYVVGTYN